MTEQQIIDKVKLLPDNLKQQDREEGLRDLPWKELTFNLRAISVQ